MAIKLRMSIPRHRPVFTLERHWSGGHVEFLARFSHSQFVGSLSLFEKSLLLVGDGDDRFR